MCKFLFDVIIFADGRNLLVPASKREPAKFRICCQELLVIYLCIHLTDAEKYWASSGRDFWHGSEQNLMLNGGLPGLCVT